MSWSVQLLIVVEVEGRLEMCPLEGKEVELYVVDGCLTWMGKSREGVNALTRLK